MWLARKRLKYDAHCCTNDLQFAAFLPVHSPPPEGMVQSFCSGALGTRYFKLRIQHRPLPRPISHTHKLVTHTIRASLFSDPRKTTAGGSASGWLWFKNNRYNRDSRAIPDRERRGTLTRRTGELLADLSWPEQPVGEDFAFNGVSQHGDPQLVLVVAVVTSGKERVPSAEFVVLLTLSFVVSSFKTILTLDN